MKFPWNRSLVPGRLAGQERGGFAKEESELVVVDPVAGIGNSDETAIADSLKARVVFGNGKKTFESPEKQDWASDLAENFDGVGDVVAIWREGAGVGVKFPKQGAVGIEIGAMQSEMAGDFVGETRVGLFHAGHGGVETCVTFGTALFEVANVFDPAASALGGLAVHRMTWRKTQAFDGDRFVYALRVDAGVMQDDTTTKRVADQANGKIVDDIEKGGEIENVLAYGVSSAGSPGAIPVAAKIEGVDMIVLAERARDPVPVAGMIESAMNENERGFVVLAVIPELKLEAVRIEEVGDRFQSWYLASL
jgi:hypothetical protein